MTFRIKPSEKKLLRSEIQFLEQYINKDAALNEQAGKTMFPFLFKMYEAIREPKPTPATFLPIPNNHNSK